MADDLPVCPEHAHLPVRLEKIKSFYAETGSLVPEDIEYLIEQAQWAIHLDSAGQNLKNAADRYITDLEQEISEQKDEISNLRNIIDSLTSEED